MCIIAYWGPLLVHNVPCASCSLVRLNVYVLKVFMSNKYDNAYEVLLMQRWLRFVTIWNKRRLMHESLNANNVQRFKSDPLCIICR